MGAFIKKNEGNRSEKQLNKEVIIKQLILDKAPNDLDGAASAGNVKRSANGFKKVPILMVTTIKTSHLFIGRQP